MRSIGVVVLLIAVSVQGLVGCGYYNDPVHRPGSVASTPFDQGQTLGFEVVKTIFARNRCLDCHSFERGNRGGINLETYVNTKPLAALLVSTTASGFMPIGGPQVSAADQAVLKAWSDAGAPETSEIPVVGGAQPAPVTPIPGEENPGEEPAPAALTFAKIKASIFVPHCVGCHAGFADYARVAPRLASIQREIDTNSMPKGGPPLSADLKSMLNAWIDAGAPESEGP